MKRDSFVFYRTWRDALKKLPDELRLQAYDATIDYALDNEITELPPLVAYALEFIKPSLDRDRTKYEAMCERNKRNSKNAGRPKIENNPEKSTGFPSIPTQNPKESPIIMNNDNDNDYNNEIEDEYSFDKFWDLYDKKCGDKAKLRTKWGRLALRDKKAIFEYIPKYKEARPDKKYRKDPQTFLNNHSWEDELVFENGTSGQTGKIQTDGFSWNK